MKTETQINTDQIAAKAFHLGGMSPGKGANWRGLMFSIQFLTGNKKAYPYADVRQINYEKDKIEVELGTEKLIIRGRYLENCYEGLIDHLVREIVEADAKHQTAPDGEAFIQRIEIIDR